MYYVTLKNRFCLDYLNQTIMGAFSWKLVFVSFGAFKVGAGTFLLQQHARNPRNPQSPTSKDSQVHPRLLNQNPLDVGGDWDLCDLNVQPT